MTDNELADLRRDFALESLSETSVDKDPFEQFSLWMHEALRSHIIDANAMTLSTVDAEGRPAARIVLLKGFSSSGFRFFTNYESKKARDLAANPNAVLHFFWPELERQVAVYGTAAKIAREESEAYFLSRPLESRIGAWASKQSSVISSRADLESRAEEIRARFGENVPLPPFWGGFNLTPSKFEFWQGRRSRLHDRICFELSETTWNIYRLSP